MFVSHLKPSSSRYNCIITNTVFLFYERINFKHRQILKSGKGTQGKGCCRGGFSEKLLESSPMPDRINDSWLQDGPTAGQGGSTSVITGLRRGKKCCTAAVREDQEDVRKITLQAPRSG